jgi:AAA domain
MSETTASTPSENRCDHRKFEWLTDTGWPLWRRSLMEEQEEPVPWLWHGYLARGHLTLLTGQWKIGKTHLLAALLARLEKGGELLGRRVEPGRAIVITEEGRTLWLRRIIRHNIGDGVSFAFEPWLVRPDRERWETLVDDLDKLRHSRGLELVVIDSLASILPGQEEANAAAMTELLHPLRTLAHRGPAVLLAHHPRKGPAPGGQSARGTGALPASVDFNLELHWAGPAANDSPRRKLLAWSRFEETPRRAIFQLSECGTDYELVEEEPGVPTEGVVGVVENILRSAPELTAREVQERWPAGSERPRLRSLTEWLRELSDEGRLVRSGHGHRYVPFRYRLADPRPAAAAEPAAPGEPAVAVESASRGEPAASAAG